MMEELKQHVVARPFKPFRVVMRDGVTLDVTRKFQVGIGKTRFTVADDRSGRARDFSIDQVASIQMIDSQERLNDEPQAPVPVVANSGISNEGNMIDELKQHVVARPFKPFRLVLRDGATLDVTRKFQVAIGLTRFIYADDHAGRSRLFPIDQVTLLQVIDNATAA